MSTFPAGTRRTTRLVGDLAHAFGCGMALWLSGIAQAQDVQAHHRLLAADALALLTHADAGVRGEAALVVARSHDPAHLPAVLAVARDRNQRARLRGLLALGVLGVPGCAESLAAVLEDSGDRHDLAGLAAAAGLGLLPPAQNATAVTRALTSFLHGSHRRQLELQRSLLVTLGREPQPDQRTSLRRLYDDESLRDPQLRADLLHLLLAFTDEFDLPKLCRLLERGSPEEVQVALAWLADHTGDGDAALLALVERHARGGERAALRAQALVVLARFRHQPALVLADRALRAAAPDEAAAGLQVVLQLGTPAMRGAMERQLTTEADPERLRAFLQAWSMPPGEALLDRCARLAADRSGRTDTALRVAAVETLARSAANRAEPMLRDLFASCTAPDELRTLSRRLASTPQVPMARLLPPGASLDDHPDHWRALLAIGHPEAIRHLLVRLRDPAAAASELTQALRLWREATDDDAVTRFARLPERLRSALGN